MKFPLRNFLRFCESLKIDSKELGVIHLGKQMLGTQRYLVSEIAKGMEDGVHDFIVLKARQLGITVICLALDLYWHQRFPGMQGTLIADTDENREMFRTTLSFYLEGLDVSFRVPITGHNRSQLVFENRSRIAYQTAGTKKTNKAPVGVGKAIVFAHMTELSNWGNDSAADIEASLAQSNPKRLYVRESTARGYNGFYDSWEVAKTSSTQRAIFIGWWRNEMYQISRDDKRFKRYWDGNKTSDEKDWSREVKALYDVDITPEQFAWWRWMHDEKVQSETDLYQNYPPTESYAFQMTGSQFFPSLALSDRMSIAKRTPFDSYRFILSSAFVDTEVVPSNERVSTLKVWEHPDSSGHYVLGADPAWGSSDWADRFCAQIFRCYADGMEQVAEFCTPDCTTAQFAWVLVYLASLYSSPQAPIKMNIEINGPGQAVFQEFQNLRRLAFSLRDESKWVALAGVIQNIHNYLYKRVDSMSGGYAYHWKTTPETKSRMLNRMKDHFMNGEMTIRSTALLEEMKVIIHEGGHFVDPGRKKDDRVIAAALAGMPWDENIRIALAQMRHTKDAVKLARERNITASGTHVGKIVDRHLKSIGVVIR